MTERPKWLKVVGGTEHQSGHDAQIDKTKEPSDAELLRLYQERKDNRPVDLERMANKRTVEQFAPSLSRWSKAEIHGYLLNDGLWKKPSHTLAVLEEVRLRMLSGSLGPRN